MTRQCTGWIAPRSGGYQPIGDPDQPIPPPPTSRGGASPRITDHAPWPGPLHYAYRCRVCGEDVAEHAGPLRRLLARRRARRERSA